MSKTTMKHSPQSLAKQFTQGVYVNALSTALWQDTFRYLATTVEPSLFQKQKINTLWTIYGGDLRAKIKDDTLILRVLKKSLPGYDGPGMVLYRGESWFLFDQNHIGFCWTPSIDVATTYAKGLNAVESGGVLLKSYAPPAAILAAPNNTSTQAVYLCDPEQLQRLTTLALFAKP